MKIFLLTLVLYISTCLPLFATRWCISPNGGGSHTGSNWANACDASQLATLITNAPVGDSLFVAEGKYVPTTNPTNVWISFDLKTGTKIFGGFPAPSGAIPNPSWIYRDPKLYPTILSGDIGFDDLDVNGNPFDQTISDIVGGNSNSVLYIPQGCNNITIDGFIISGGDAKTGNGGGIYWNYNSVISLKNCYLVGNLGTRGGAIYNYSGGLNSQINSCVFGGNEANQGAAIYNHVNVQTAVKSCKFINNIADLQGGAIYNHYSGSILITNSVFSNNTADYGGALYNNHSSMTFANVIMAANNATEGGAFYNNFSSPLIVNSTIAANNVVNNGGGISNNGNSAPKIRNSILAANAVDDMISNTNAVPLIVSSIIQNFNANNCINCPGNYGHVDPQFIDINNLTGADGIWMTNDDGLRLKPCSPAINAGNNFLVPAYLTTDAKNGPRILQSFVEIGAYEMLNFAGAGYHSTLNSSNQQSVATEECLDIGGWTHYYDTTSRKIILSVFKNGYDIGSLNDGIFNVFATTTNSYGSGTAVNVTAPYTSNNSWFVMNRWWNVTPNPQLPAGNTGVKVRTYFTGQDTVDINGSLQGNDVAINQLRFYKINGGSANLDPNGDGNCNDAHAGINAATAYNTAGFWEYLYAPTSSINTWSRGDFNGVKYAEYEIAQFSGGGGGAFDGLGAMPILLLFFDGNSLEKGNRLFWETSEEMPNGHFVIERSSNGYDFEDIGFLSCGEESHQYSFLDDQPLNGRNYYRLRLTDFESYSEYSAMIELLFTRFSFEVYPNPAKEFIFIDGNFPADYKLTIYDQVGTLIQTSSLNSNITTEINLEYFTCGIYYFKLHNSKGEVIEVKRIVIGQ